MWARLPRATRNWFGLNGASQNWSRGLIGLLALLLTVGSSWACETPVYRYAMYRWQPTPYEVYSFHDDSNSEAHAAVEEAIADVSEGTDNRANVVFIPVNLTADPELNGLTPDIKAAWTSQKDRSLPSYLISTPYGVQIYSGKLDIGTIETLVESPARKLMAQQLEAGKIGVLLFLSGKDKKENERTKKILQGLVKEVGEGKISLYSAPSDDAASEEESATANPGLELGLIEVKRDDKKEAWLVRSLLAMESDLPDESRPMVFLSYGRGRALLPYIGEGITRENLLREVEFISGACSCTVKEQNPGVDLLVRYDWDAASAALADRFGTEEGNEGQFGPTDFLPQLIIPSSTAPPVEAVAGTSDAPGTTKDSSTGEPKRSEGTDGENVAATTDDIPVEGDGASRDARTDDVDTATSAVASADEPAGSEGGTTARDSDHGSDDEVASMTPVEAFTVTVPAFQPARSYVSMLVVGGGLALGLVILFGVTFFVMRPH
ncbi:MAG: hypothetical protein QGF59_00175 [Pirellulaceae bacterium]|nr:hypothetical protein [Pirellulaceae bacterium]MDP6717028.1 hypothetical protein [Pirellulaceae bacterium]